MYMKNILSLLLLAVCSSATAQWSNITNQFFDSLHMPVSRVTQEQGSPLVLRSYPDGGYFVIWQDDRSSATSKTDIYAQKYDKDGNRLWAINGNPVTTGPNAQYYNFSSNEDYRNRSFAATDSAGGFYVCYVDDSVNTYSWPRIAVQHMRSNGTAVFGGPGYIVAYTPSSENDRLSQPLLIPDGNKGFYISYMKSQYGNFIYAECFRDENGTMVSYGGGLMNQNAVQKSQPSPCGIQAYVEFPLPAVGDYNIWSDKQGGCNVIMSLNQNGTQGKMLGFNRLWRAKKNAAVTDYHRNEGGSICPYSIAYQKDQVYPLYRFLMSSITIVCGGPVPYPVYAVRSDILRSNGFKTIDNGAYDYNFPKGVTVTTDGDINVDVIASTRRDLVNNSPTDFAVQAIAYKVEKYDSIPYQRTTFNDPEIGYNITEPAVLNKFLTLRDTVLGRGTYYYDFSLSAGGSEVYLGGLMSTTYGFREVRLQHLKVQRASADSFGIRYLAPKIGQKIGTEVSTGFSGSDIFYDLPIVTVDTNGKALFSIKESGRSTRISPILDSTQLRWGAMGRAIGTSISNYGYYNSDQPVVALDPNDGSGIIAWRDARYIAPTSTGNDIYMRHLDRLGEFLYTPPLRPIRTLPNPYGPTPANPAVLYGTSHQFTAFETSSISYEPSTTTLAEMVDDYNLGRVQMSVHQNRTGIRSYNGLPYLDRNLNVKVDNVPSSSNMLMRIYFTKTEFDAFKVASSFITDPSDLAIISQPNNTGNVPTVYAPVAGEKTSSVVDWDSLPGGYYVQFYTRQLGDFFLMKAGKLTLCPGGSTSISSDITGATYQWQVDNGTGYFVPISDNANYSGTTTSTLQLNNLPSTFYGYRYQCLVNATLGNTSNIFTLQFLANWVGGSSTDWNNPANWGCGSVPDANTDVMVNSGNVILTSNGSCRTLTVKPGASVTVKPGVNLIVTH